MKISVIGTGCVDINEEKVKQMQQGVVPIYEPNFN
jgi:UDP-glucose 6-dehydrogenase